MPSRSRKLFPVLLIGLATGAAAACAGTSTSPAGERQSVAATLPPRGDPAVEFEGLPARTRPDGIEPALLDAIASWLASEFALPAMDDRPKVAFASARRMNGLRAQRMPRVSVGDRADEIVALYDNATGTIYLPKEWTGATPAELSILVHEMVHHLQDAAGESFRCVEAREKMAYEAQARWLDAFGGDLAAEFGIDLMTLLLRTSCFR